MQLKTSFNFRWFWYTPVFAWWWLWSASHQMRYSKAGQIAYVKIHVCYHDYPGSNNFATAQHMDDQIEALRNNGEFLWIQGEIKRQYISFCNRFAKAVYLCDGRNGKEAADFVLDSVFHPLCLHCFSMSSIINIKTIIEFILLISLVALECIYRFFCDWNFSPVYGISLLIWLQISMLIAKFVLFCWTGWMQFISLVW